MPIGLLFPGQGSQYVGMGEDLFDACPETLVEAADEVLGWSLRTVCLEGPEGLLTATDRAQPALFALAYALWEEFRGAGDLAIAGAAGHSLGEYTALAAAGIYSFEEGLRLVAERGAAMGAAATSEGSGMAALLGVDPDTAETVSAARREAGGRLWVANLNAPGQVVVAGGLADLDWLQEHARAYGVRRVMPLNVAGAFHTPFMEPARPRLTAALEATSFSPGRFPVWSNVTARPVDEGEVAASLATQITSPVRFSDSLLSMARAGVDVFVHVGPGDVTAGMARRTVPEAEVVVVDSLAAIPPAIDRISSIGTMTPDEEG